MLTISKKFLTNGNNVSNNPFQSYYLKELPKIVVLVDDSEWLIFTVNTSYNAYNKSTKKLRESNIHADIEYLSEDYLDLMEKGYKMLNATEKAIKLLKNINETVLSSPNINIALTQDVFNVLVMENFKLLDLLDKLFGGRDKWHVASFSAKKHSNELGWHRDYPYSTIINPSDETFSIQVNWMCGPFTELNGATEILVGSHYSKSVPQEAPRKLMVGDTGTIFLYHAAMWHKPGQNYGEPERAAIVLANFAHINIPKKVSEPIIS